MACFVTSKVQEQQLDVPVLICLPTMCGTLNQLSYDPMTQNQVQKPTHSRPLIHISSPLYALQQVVNDYALEVGGVMVAPNRNSHLRTWVLNRHLKKIPYFMLDGLTVHVFDGRRPNGPPTSPYTNKSFDLANPQCFDQIETFLSIDPNTGHI